MKKEKKVTTKKKKCSAEKVVNVSATIELVDS